MEKHHRLTEESDNEGFAGDDGNNAEHEIDNGKTEEIGFDWENERNGDYHSDLDGKGAKEDTKR